MGFPDHASDKEFVCQYRRHKIQGVDLWEGKSLGGGQGNPLQYSCLWNPIDRRAWQATVHGVAKSQTWLSMHAHTHTHTHTHTHRQH